MNSDAQFDPACTEVPALAVVGHPNKGKSSIVATLAQDPSIHIADESGTTRTSAAYPLTVDDRPLYRLIDTPGFQRPRKTLAWLLDHETTDDKRPEVVAAFVEAHRQAEAFRDEVELLTPIVQGAGIVYVVDGSVPYGPSYKPEMEILRWTNQPSVALINPIGPADHIDEWKAALGQYFRVVRVFNAVQAGFEKQLSLLTALGEVHEDWRPAMQQAVTALRDRRRGQRRLAASANARMLTRAVLHTQERDLEYHAGHHAIEDAQGKLQSRYRDDLRGFETDARRAVQEAFGHQGLAVADEDLDVLAEDLFSEASQRLFGLTRTQAALTSAGAGAAGTAILDLAAGGASLGIFTAGGAAVGGLAGWFGFDKVANVQVLKLRKLGVRRVSVGPVRSASFRAVLLTRACLHYQLISRRTHARRDEVSAAMKAGAVTGESPSPESGALKPNDATDAPHFDLPEGLLKSAESHLKVAARGGEAAADAEAQLVDVLEAAFEEIEGEAR